MPLNGRLNRTEPTIPTNDHLRVGTLIEKGKHPCHVTTMGSMGLVANYSSGNTCFFDVYDTGLKILAVDQHEGSGPNKDRQEAPHAHSTWFDPKVLSGLILHDLRE